MPTQKELLIPDLHTLTHQEAPKKEEPFTDLRSTKEVGKLALSLYKFAQAATAKHHRPGGLNRPLPSHRSGFWKPEIGVSAGLVSPEVSLHGLETTGSSLCLHMAIPLCTSVSLPLPMRTRRVGLGPTPMTSFDLSPLFRDLLSKYCAEADTIEGLWEPRPGPSSRLYPPCS